VPFIGEVQRGLDTTFVQVGKDNTATPSQHVTFGTPVGVIVSERALG
jgi:hypothetical protein